MRHWPKRILYPAKAIAVGLARLLGYESVEPALVELRATGQEGAIIFIHGFSGNANETWGEFPSYIIGDDRLRCWDVFTLGYGTRLAPDIAGVWAADAPIQRLSQLFSTTLKVPLQTYKAVALIAHSMGGLIVQRALLDDNELRSRTCHVFLFGVPSGGIYKASMFGFAKRQIRDMAPKGAFIDALRNDWNKTFPITTPFSLWVAAGDRDEFVQADSALTPFPRGVQAVVNGDHLQIVKPTSATALSVQLVINGILGNAAPTGPWNSARVAVELRDFQSAIHRLSAHEQELDESGLVQLALALVSVGREDEGIDLLTRNHCELTDAIGTLAGRLKRRWLSERRRKDYDSALRLYGEAKSLATTRGNADQMYYHAVNIAFMHLAGSEQAKAVLSAQESLLLAENGREELWKQATKAEALLILRRREQAVEHYRNALAFEPSPREIESMYKQAIWISEIYRDSVGVRELSNLFRPSVL